MLDGAMLYPNESTTRTRNLLRCVELQKLRLSLEQQTNPGRGLLSTYAFRLSSLISASRDGDVLESRASRADRVTWFYAGSVVVIENHSGQKYCEVKLWRRKAPSAGRTRRYGA